jgi:tetratricopeptide (TPR) repeat protein
MHYFLGYPDTALSKMSRAIQLADRVGHPLSRAAARTFTIFLLQWLRTDDRVPELAAETVSICEAHRLPFFRAWTDASLAYRLISNGELELGRQKMAVALDDYIGSAGELAIPWLRCLLAEAHALAGEAERGLADVADAFEMAERNGDRWMLCEMYRLAGRVSQAAQRIAEAEERYEQAIRVSHEQGAKSLELRAAVDLGRLWADQGAPTKAAALLRPLCEFFVEGLTTQDFIDAKSLMKQCAKGADFFTPEEPHQ